MTPILTCTLTPGCENPVEGRTNGCASCNFEARRAEKQAKKVKIVRQVMKVTPKRANQLQEYYVLKKEFLEANPCCMVEDCTRRSAEVHHRGTRTNHNLTDVDNFFGVCRPHHVMITEDSKWAKENGYSDLRTVNAEKV